MKSGCWMRPSIMATISASGTRAALHDLLRLGADGAPGRDLGAQHVAGADLG